MESQKLGLDTFRSTFMVISATDGSPGPFGVCKGCEQRWEEGDRIVQVVDEVVDNATLINLYHEDCASR